MSEQAFCAAGARLAPVRRWRLHLGAHKTATSHLQETLARLRPALAARGVDVLPSRAVRARGLAPEVARPRLAVRVPVLGRRQARRSIERLLEPLRLGPGTVALSEENLLGAPQQLLSGAFYPNAGRNLARLASLGERAELAVFLSIRALDTFLPSAYAEALKYRPPPEGGFEAFRDRLLARLPSWSELATRLRQAAPGATLRVWRHEDYREHAECAIAAFCGCEVRALPTIPDPVHTRTPSAAGIRAAEALPDGLAPRERAARVRAIYAAAEPGQDRFRPFSDAERIELRAAYELDLERLERTAPGTLIRLAAEG